VRSLPILPEGPPDEDGGPTGRSLAEAAAAAVSAERDQPVGG
jgi:hypothetical protein